VPTLGPGGRCPASTGTDVHTKFFTGPSLGGGPVRVLLADTGDVVRGNVGLFPSGAPRWYALQTLWYALPSYRAPFVVRAAKVGARGPIEVRPGADGTSPGVGPLVVPVGPTLNTFDGYRTLPGSTWVHSAGCYAWQIDGATFSEVIVVDATMSSSRSG